MPLLLVRLVWCDWENESVFIYIYIYRCIRHVLSVAVSVLKHFYKMPVRVLCLAQANIHVSSFISSPEPKAHWCAYSIPVEPASMCASVRPCVNTFKHEYLCNQLADRNEILSEASLGWGKASVGFDPDRIRTLVSMATDSSHRVIMGKRRHHVFSIAFDWILFILAGNDDMHKSLDEFEIWPNLTTDYGVSCP